MHRKLTLDLDALTITSFETHESAVDFNAGPSAATVVPCCPNPCNTRLTCSSSLC